MAAPGVRMNRLGFENRTGRREQSPERSRRPGDEAAERRRGSVQGRELRFAQHGKARQCGARGDGSGIDALEALGIGGGGQRLAQHIRQAGKQLGLAFGRRARFESVVVFGHG